MTIDARQAVAAAMAERANDLLASLSHAEDLDVLPSGCHEHRPSVRIETRSDG